MGEGREVDGGGEWIGWRWEVRSGWRWGVNWMEDEVRIGWRVG